MPLSTAPPAAGPTSPPATQTTFNYPPPPSAAVPSTYPLPPQQPQAQQQQKYFAPPPAAGVPAQIPSPQPLPSHVRTPSQQHQHQQQPQFALPPQAPSPSHPADEKAAINVKNAQEAEDELKPSNFSYAATASSTQQASGAPPPGAFVGAGSVTDDVGTFNGGSYRISHRDSNTILTVQLAYGCPIEAKPGTLISMSPSITLKGDVKFSVKKLVAGGQMSSSTFTGPGELLLGPAMLGDMTVLRLTGKDTWSVGQDSFVACTQGVVKDFKRQSLGKAIFSGEGWWIYKIQGVGLLWITSFGSIIKKDLVDGEQYIVDNGHLVAWNTKYILERVASGGIISGMASAEGLVCKFTGPGTVYIQTRNAVSFFSFFFSFFFFFFPPFTLSSGTV